MSAPTSAPDRLGTRAPGGTADNGGSRPWLRRAGLIPLAAALAAFAGIFTPAYLSLDPGRSRMPINPDPAVGPLHYVLLVAHVVTGLITFATICPQLAPVVRRRHPAAHRWSGRLYVFAGMLPTSLLALAVNPIAVLGPVAHAGTVVWGALGVSTTALGWWFARRRRWVEHRRWMLASIATATGVVTGRALSILTALCPGLALDTPAGLVLAQVHGFWLGWMVNLGVVGWWLRRRPVPSR